MTARLLSAGYVRAPVLLPGGLDTTAARAASPTLPGGWRLDPPGDSRAPAAVEVTLGPPAIAAGPATVRICLPPGTASSQGPAYVTYTALERARQQQGKVTVHATAVLAPDGQAVLLLGGKGAGKTSTALELAARGWVHAGDDLVVLGTDPGGQLAVWPGKPAAAVRDPRAPLAPKPVTLLEPFAAGPAPLGRVVRLAVHPGLPAALAPAVPLSLNETLRLHELLARYISGLPTPLAGAGAVPYGPVWPLDTPDLARWRSQLIARLAAARFSYLHAPDAAAAASLITREAAR
jgi:hypothetical protein